MSLEYEAELIIPNCTWEWNNPVLRKRGELNKTRERERERESFWSFPPWNSLIFHRKPIREVKLQKDAFKIKLPTSG